MNFSDMKEVEHEVDRLLNLIQPLEKSNNKRHQVSDFVRKIVTKQISNTVIVECGSSSLKSYLPESDLDLVLFTLKKQKLSPTQTEIFYLKHIFNSLCDEIISKEENRSLHYDMNIRNVEFINARIKITHCIVNNINVDITVQHISSIVTLLFLEEVDKLIGNNHLFKRSLLLIKDWCLHESVAYCGVSILGSKLGMLSSYSISVLVLYLFNKYDTSVLTHPIIVLRYFLHTYMNFSWDLYILTISGPQLITHNGGGNDGQNFSAGVNKFQIVVDKLHYFLGGGDLNGWLKSQGVTTNDHSGVDKKTTTSDTAITMNKNSGTIKSNNTVVISNGNVNNTFAYRCCNIQDPMDRVNNLAFSVTRTSLQSIELALREGHKKLVSLLQIMANHQILLQQQKLNQEQYNMNVVKNLTYNNNSNSNNNNTNSNNGNNNNNSINNSNIGNNNNNSINGGISSSNKQSNIPGISQKNRRSHSMTDTTLYQNKLYRSPQQQTINTGAENASINIAGHTPTAALFAQQQYQPQYHSVPQYISDTKSVDSNSSNESYNSNFSVPSSIKSLNSYNGSNISSAKNKTPNNTTYNNNVHNINSSNSSYSYVNNGINNVNSSNSNSNNINSNNLKNTNGTAVTNNNTTVGTTNSTHNIHINTNIITNNDTTISPGGSKATKSQKRKETQAQLIQMMKVDNNSSIHVNTTNSSSTNNSSTNNNNSHNNSNSKSDVVPTGPTNKNGTSSKLSGAVSPTNVDTKSTTNTNATAAGTNKTNKRNKANKSPSPALAMVTDSENQPQSSTTVAILPKEQPAVEFLAESELTVEPDICSATEEMRAPVSAVSSCSDDAEEGQEGQWEQSDTPQNIAHHIPQFSPQPSPETVMSTDVISALTTLQNTPAGDAGQDEEQEQQLRPLAEAENDDTVNDLSDHMVSVEVVDRTEDQQTSEQTSDQTVEQTSSLEDFSVLPVESTEIVVDEAEVAAAGADFVGEGIADEETSQSGHAAADVDINSSEMVINSNDELANTGGDSVRGNQQNHIADTISDNNSSVDSKNNGNLFKKAMNKINKQNRSDSTEDLRKSITKSTSKSNLVGELLKSITKGTAPNETVPKVNLDTVNAFVNALNAEMSPAATSKSHSIDTQSSKNSVKHYQSSAISATNTSANRQETVTPTQEPEETPQYSPEITETPVILSPTSSSNSLLSPHNNNNSSNSNSGNVNSSPMANNNSGGKINKRNIKSPPLLLPVNISTIPARNQNSNNSSNSISSNGEKPSPSPRVKPNQTASQTDSHAALLAQSPRNAQPPVNTGLQDMQPPQHQQQQQYFHKQGTQSGDVRSHSAPPPPPLVQQSPASQRYLYDQQTAQQTAQYAQQQPQVINNLVPGMQVQIPQYSQQQYPAGMPVFDGNGNLLYLVPPGETFHTNSNITGSVNGNVIMSPAHIQQQQQQYLQAQSQLTPLQLQQQQQHYQNSGYFAGPQTTGVPVRQFAQNDPQNVPHMQHHTQYNAQQYPQVMYPPNAVPHGYQANAPSMHPNGSQNVPLLVPPQQAEIHPQQFSQQQQQQNNLVYYNTTGGTVNGAYSAPQQSQQSYTNTANHNTTNRLAGGANNKISPMNQQSLSRNQMQYQQIHNNDSRDMREQNDSQPQLLQKKLSNVKIDHGSFASQPHTPTAAQQQQHVKQQYDPHQQQYYRQGEYIGPNSGGNSNGNNKSFFAENNDNNNINGNSSIYSSNGEHKSNNVNNNKMSSNSSVGSNHSTHSTASAHHNHNSHQHSIPVSSASTGFTPLPPTTVLQSLQRGPSPAVSNGKHIQPNMVAGHQNNIVGNNNHGNSNNSHNSNGIGQHNNGNNNTNSSNISSNSSNNNVANSNITLNSIGGTIGPVENFFIQHFFPLTIKNYLLINILNTPSSDSITDNTNNSSGSSKAEISVNNMYSDTTVIRSDLMDHPLQFINMVNNAQAVIVQQQQQQSLLLNGKGLNNSNINSTGGNSNSNASGPNSVRSTPVMSGKHKNFTQSPQLTANFNTTTHYPNNTPNNNNNGNSSGHSNSNNSKAVQSTVAASDVNRPLTPERDVLFSDTDALWDALQKIVAAENACCSDDEGESDTAQTASVGASTVSKSTSAANQKPTAAMTTQISVVTPIEINPTSTTESNSVAATLSPTKRFLSIFARTSSNSGHSTPVSKPAEGGKIVSASNNTTEVDSGISSSNSSSNSGIIAAAASALNTLTSIATTATTTTSATPTTTTENTVTPIKDNNQRIAPNSANSIGSSGGNSTQNNTQNNTQNSNSHGKQKPGKGNKQRMSGNKSSASSVPSAPTANSTSNNRNRNNSSGSANNSNSSNGCDGSNTNIDIPKLTFTETYIITITDCWQFICVKYQTICTTIRVAVSSYSKPVLKFMKVYKLDKMWVKILSFLNKYRVLYDNNQLLIQFIATVALSIVFTLAFVYCYRVALQQFYVQLIAGTIHLSYPIATQWNFFKFSNSSGNLHPNNCTGGTYMNGYCTIFSNHTELMLHNDDFNVFNTNHSIATHWVRVGDSISFGTDISQISSRTKIPNILAIAANANDENIHDSIDNNGNNSGNNNNSVFKAGSILSTIEYFWTKDTKNITLPAGQKHLSYYTIQKSTFMDSGHYRCFMTLWMESPAVGGVVTSTGRRVQMTYLVTETIVHISKEPKVRNKPSYQEVKQGTNFLLELHVTEGSPPPQYQWYKNGYAELGRHNQSIYFHHINISDSGTYSCDVYNIAGGFVWLEATIAVVP